MRKKELNLKRRKKIIMELTKEMVEEYFDNECDFYMNLYPSEDIIIKRFHLRDAEACEFADMIEGNPKLDFKIYSDKNNYRYSYVEVWRIADRTKDYFEDLHAEWDEDNDRKLFYFKQEERLKEILKHVDGDMNVEGLKKLISKVEYEQWNGLE